MPSLSTRVNEALERKDYPVAFEVFQEVDALFERLGDEDRRAYASIRREVDYGLTVVSSRMGKTDEALAAFERAPDNGYTNYNAANADPDLAFIRQNPAFTALLERIKEYDLVAALRSARACRADMPRPEFTYQLPDAEGLRALRAEFNLDSIAGSGDELSRIKNLMIWVHNTVRHNGSNPPVAARSASAQIAHFRETGKGVNCRMMSIPKRWTNGSGWTRRSTPG